jgi:hypothetical protein
MRAALPLLTAAVLVTGALASSGILNRSQHSDAASAGQIEQRTDALNASFGEYRGLASGLQESDFITFAGYSKNGAGETFAQFYDELSQTIFVLDRKSVDERVKNLKEQGLPANATERAVRYWPARRNVEF